MYKITFGYREWKVRNGQVGYHTEDNVWTVFEGRIWDNRRKPFQAKAYSKAQKQTTATWVLHSCQ